MNRHSLDHRVGSCKIDTLKHAETLLIAAVRFYASQTVTSDNHYLARFHVPQYRSAHTLYGAGFRGCNIPAVGLAENKRSEPVRVAECYQFCCSHKHAGIRALDVVHCKLHSFFRGAAFQPRRDYGIGYRFGVGSAVEYRSVQLEFSPQLLRVGEVAVVCEGHIALDVTDDERLEVFWTAAARG